MGCACGDGGSYDGWVCVVCWIGWVGVVGENQEQDVMEVWLDMGSCIAWVGKGVAGTLSICR